MDDKNMLEMKHRQVSDLEWISATFWQNVTCNNQQIVIAVMYVY